MPIGAHPRFTFFVQFVFFSQYTYTMETSGGLDLGSVVVGLTLGIGLTYLWFRNHISSGDLQGKYILLTDHHVVAQQLSGLREQHQELLSCEKSLRGEVGRYKEDFKRLHEDIHQHRTSFERERSEHAATRDALTRVNSKYESVTQRLEQQKLDFEKLHQHARDEFANLSHRLLKQSSGELREVHGEALKHLLDPVKLKLQEFHLSVERKFSDEGKDKAALRTQIEQLTTLNQDLSREARQLTQALKGDSKKQGDWGELQLERLLEAAGLHAGTHFDTQSNFKNEAGENQRPDCIIKLPGDRCLVVDAKVSLTAYERYCASESDEDGKLHLGLHIKSMREHIKGLSAKRYQEIYQINTPDYVLMFVPLEPAFIAAVRERNELFTDALNAKIVLVCPSTLLATMRTVAYIWQQDNQRANAEEIAAIGAKLYDKFAGFVDDMEAIGSQLDKARHSYDSAMNKLSRSPKQSTTLLAQANQLRELGVSGKKVIGE